MDAYAQPIRAALSCVIRVPMFTYESVEVNRSRSLMLVNMPIELRRESSSERRAGPLNLPDLAVAILHDYHIVKDDDRSYRATTDSWTYQILDDEGREVLAYHWDSAETPATPHLHVGSVLMSSEIHYLSKTFSNLHLPTERISIERIVYLLIKDFEVVPLRDDWEDVLSRGQQGFEENRSWPRNRFNP